MKNLVLSLIFLATSSAFAIPANPETTRVTKLLLHLPDIVAQLIQENTDALKDIVVAEVKPGVNNWVLTFQRSCFCLPTTGTVNVVEDLRPTFVDGPAVYSATVTFVRK